MEQKSLACERISSSEFLGVLFLHQISENRLIIGTVAPGKTLSLLALLYKVPLRAARRNRHYNVDDFRHLAERGVIYCISVLLQTPSAFVLLFR